METFQKKLENSHYLNINLVTDVPFLRVLTLVQSLSILLFALRVNGATTQETASFMPIISNLLALYCKSEGLLLVISAMNNNYARVATGKVTCAIQAVTPIATCLT